MERLSTAFRKIGGFFYFTERKQANDRTAEKHRRADAALRADGFPELCSVQPNPTGLHILGGAPKIGKSWLMLWLCLQVARGENVWNYESKKGAVPYLCLEDSYERIQSRLLHITEDAPDNLFFSVMSESLAEGLVEQTKVFLDMGWQCSAWSNGSISLFSAQDTSKHFCHPYP